MRHLEIRDLWLQREVGLGKVVVVKIEGPKKPADLMTKYLKSQEIKDRLETRHQDQVEKMERPRGDAGMKARKLCGEL